jgi:DNA-binding IclR family transcriptional regulator
MVTARDAPNAGRSRKARVAGPGRAGRGEVLVLNKASAILDFMLAERRELGPTDIADALGASKTTTYRLLRSLEKTGLLDRHPGGTYRLGVKLIAFGRAVESRLDLRREAQPIVERLARSTRQTAFVFVPGETGALCILRVPGEDVEVLAVAEGGVLAYHAGAAPKVLLAYLGEDRIAAYLKSTAFERFTEATTTDPTELRRELAEIRARGYSISWGDVTSGVGALGAPVFGSDGSLVAAVSISGITVHFGSRSKPWHVRELLEAAAEISRRLGSGTLTPQRDTTPSPP